MLGACADDDKSHNVYLETDASPITQQRANARGLTYNGGGGHPHQSNTYWMVTDQEPGSRERSLSFTMPGSRQRRQRGPHSRAAQRQQCPFGRALKLVTNRNVSTTVTLSRTGIDEQVYLRRRRLRHRGRRHLRRGTPRRLEPTCAAWASRRRPTTTTRTPPSTPVRRIDDHHDPAGRRAAATTSPFRRRRMWLTLGGIAATKVERLPLASSSRSA